MKVGLGGHDLGDKGTSEPVNEIERFVSEIFIHPQYFPPSYKNDLALLKLHAPVSFSPTVIPICIPNNDNSEINSNVAKLTQSFILQTKRFLTRVHECTIYS